MYIEPNSVIKIYNNIPLDNTYEHTIFFKNLSEQNAYFHPIDMPKAKYVLSAQSYQRVVKGSMRVEKKAEDLYDCNYLAFQNTSFGSKWFYAFITSVEYVNNITSEITFEIDVLQTYFFNYTLKKCFVEREHSTTDVIGENILPEPLATGEYVYDNYEPLISMNDYLVLISYVDTNDSGSVGELYDGVYSGTKIKAFKSTDTKNIDAFLTGFLNAPDSIVSMYMCPAILIENVPDGGKNLTYGTSGMVTHINCETQQLNGNEKFSGYTPKNKKLYTYPYNYFMLDNASGQSLVLRYEMFNDKRLPIVPIIELAGTITQPVKVIARPCSYKGTKSYSELGGYTSLNTESLALENYPMCSWNIDSFSAWIAQNSLPIGLNLISGGASTFIGSNYSMHPTASLTTGLVGQVANVASQVYSASILADVCKGNQASGNVNISCGKQKIYASRVHITADFAKVIDNFFSKFGYATNRLKVPNRDVRPHWTYCKTNGCIITGKMPADDIKKVCNIYDNGITFWKNASEVGDYSLDNSV